jgi:cytochrome P450
MSPYIMLLHAATEIPTFLTAGTGTTSTSTSRAIFLLTQYPDVQRKLRDELLAVSSDMPSMDELQSLPFLDAVTRETLRLHAPVPGVSRIATHDDVIPFNEPFLDREGVKHSDIR